MNKKISLAVVGPGLIGKKHISLISKNAFCNLSGIVAPLDDDNIAISQKFGVPLFESIELLVASVKVDGIIISSPNMLHFEHGKICIERKIPILLEKPICNDFKSGLELVKLTKMYSSKVLIGHHRAHSNIIDAASEIIKAGRIGKIVSISASAQFYKPDDYFVESPWRSSTSGGPVLINLIHEIGVLRTLCGEVEAVQAILSNSIRGRLIEDTAVINFKFLNGALGSFILSDTAATSRSWEQTSGENLDFATDHNENCYLISGTKGSLLMPSMKLKFYNTCQESSWLLPLKEEQIFFLKTDPLEAQLMHFIDLIKGNVEPKVTAMDGLLNLKIVEAIYTSSRLGNIQKIDNIFC